MKSLTYLVGLLCYVRSANIKQMSRKQKVSKMRREELETRIDKRDKGLQARELLASHLGGTFRATVRMDGGGGWDYIHRIATIINELVLTNEEIRKDEELREAAISFIEIDLYTSLDVVSDTLHELFILWASKVIPVGEEKKSNPENTIRVNIREFSSIYEKYLEDQAKREGFKAKVSTEGIRKRLSDDELKDLDF